LSELSFSLATGRWMKLMKLLMIVVKEMDKGPFASVLIMHLVFPSGAKEADAYEFSEF